MKRKTLDMLLVCALTMAITTFGASEATLAAEDSKAEESSAVLESAEETTEEESLLCGDSFCMVSYTDRGHAGPLCMV